MARCAGSSLAGVALEFVLLTVLVSVCHLHYLVAAALGSLAYFVVSFALYRRWAFRATTGSRWRQLAKHALVMGGGTALMMPILRLLVGTAHLPYQAGWLAGGALSFFAWTWPMQRFFTYRTAPAVVPME